jgi:predicted Rossmann fold nucleotide-binding protein DprA/Smf involved in DNA uptake
MQSVDLLTPGEYRRYARQLREIGRLPSDLLGGDSAELVKELSDIVPPDRVGRLLDRGFLFTQAIERWHSRAIWVFSRADSEYPKQIKNRLKEDSPAVLYGCGQPKLLDCGGLAVVGSRHVESQLIEYAQEVGRRCALAKKCTISGGAQGIDRAAMTGALEAGGRSAGVLADSLERAALNRGNRNWLLEEQLVLVSAYDPSAGFNVGHAMQRNKLIYGLADAALVVSADFEKGGTWAGATEQLQKYRFIPVYVRATGQISQGLEALRKMGAEGWPEPKDGNELLATFHPVATGPSNQQPELTFQSAPTVNSDDYAHPGECHSAASAAPVEMLRGESSAESEYEGSEPRKTIDPATALMEIVQGILTEVLTTPKTVTEVASELDVSKAQAKKWLDALVKEQVLGTL